MRSEPDVRFGAAPGHADGALIEQVRSALEHWNQVGQGATSSLTGGGALAAVETAVSERVAGRYTLAVSSGTAALRVALASVGVRAGSEVICPAYDWPAAAGAIASLGAKPTFAPVDPRTLTIDPASCRRLITSSTSAIVATHLFGIPADVPAIRTLVDRLSIPVVEDCAQAFGASIDGVPAGALGAAAAFSFGPGKLVDAMEGGAVAFARHEHFAQGVVASQHPLRHLTAGLEPVLNGQFHHRMHPIAAILALSAMDTMDQRLSDAAHRARTIHQAMFQHEDWTPVGTDDRRRPSWWQVPFLGPGPRSPSPAVSFTKSSARWMPVGDPYRSNGAGAPGQTVSGEVAAFVATFKEMSGS